MEGISNEDIKILCSKLNIPYPNKNGNSKNSYSFRMKLETLKYNLTIDWETLEWVVKDQNYKVIARL